MKYYWDDKEDSQSTLSKICPLSLWQPHILTLTALELNLGRNRMLKLQFFFFRNTILNSAMVRSY